MNLRDKYDLYQLHTQKWLDALQTYNDIEFQLKPSEDDWSLSQVYDHIIQVTFKCLDNALLCSEEKGEKGHSGFGPALFSWMGAFPPLKLKVKKIPQGMEHIYNPKQIERSTAIEGLNKALKKMQEALPAIEKASKDQRIKHWAGGWFNASQWYHSAEMHIKHHFRQKKRLEQFIKKQNSNTFEK